VLLARLLGALARRLGQPAVIGEVLAGIALGPTLFDGAVSDAVFPDSVRPLLSALAAVGIAVFMFVIGLEWDAGRIRGIGSLAASVSVSSILLPFGLGTLLALYLLRDHAATDRTAFMLFTGIAMSITAFPVLARILTDRDMARSPLGVVALACASIDDVLAWTLLAAVVALGGPTGPEQCDNSDGPGTQATPAAERTTDPAVQRSATALRPPVSPAAPSARAAARRRGPRGPRGA